MDSHTPTLETPKPALARYGKPPGESIGFWKTIAFERNKAICILPTTLLAYQIIYYIIIYICIDQPTLSCNVGAKKSSAAAAATTTTTAATTTTFGSRKQHHWVWLVNFWFPFDPWLFSSNACCWSFLDSEELWIPWIPVFFCRSTLDYICLLKIHR